MHVQNSHSSIFISNLHGQSITLVKPNIPGLPYEPPTELITPLGSIEYHYRTDHPDVLERVEYPDGTSESYHFEETAYPDLITGITDRRGIRNSYVEYKYPANGKAESSSLALDAEKVTALSLSSSSAIPYQRVVRNSRGHDTIMSFDKIDGVAVLSEITDCRGCDFGTASFEHEITGVLDSMTLDGVVTEFDDYDERGNPGQIVEASGTSEQRTTTIKYDDRFFDQVREIRVDSLRAGLGDKITTITRNDASDITNIRITGWDIDDTPLERVVSMRYDGPFGQLSEIDGPLDNADRRDVTSLEYYPDDVAEGFNRARLRRVLAPEGIVQVYDLQYTATGKRSFMRTANGLEVSLQYEAGNDRLELMIEYDPVTGETRKTRWTYLDTGEIETITTGFESDAATTVRFGYDDARRLTRVYDGLGNYQHFQLDTEGNPESESVYDSAGMLSKQLGRVFDAYNHIEERAQMNEVRDIYVKPNGDIEQVIDSKATTQYRYDELRRLTSIVHDVDGSDPMTADATTLIKYDHHDNIEEVTDPGSATTRYKYDDLGNVRVIDSPDGGTKYIEYDSAGNIESVLDGLQQTFVYQTDALSRTISVDMPGSEHDITFDYDDCQNGVGRLCSITNTSSSVTYSYDAWGNVLQHQSIDYLWDEANRLVSMTYPSGAEVRYGYDDASRVNSITLVRDGMETVLASGVDYEPFGPVKNLLYGNGIQMMHQRDLAWRTELIDMSQALSLDYLQYDGNGNLEIRQDSLLSQTETYSYDAIDRLSSASGLFGDIDFGYDLNGNRTSLDDGEMIGYTYEPFTNRMHTSDGTDVQVDENGNTRIRGAQALEYTPQNRLYKVYEHGNLVATYGYNGLGQRVSKRLEPSGFEVRYLYGLDGELLAETDIDGAVLKEYVYLNGAPYAVLDSDNDGDGVPNLSDNCTDHANGPLVTDAGGNTQLDTDGDGIGNRCDADFDDSGLVNSIDLGVIRNEYFSTDSDADLNGDGIVNGQDIGILKQFFFEMPGPANSDEIAIRYIHGDQLGTPKSMTDEAGLVIWTANHEPFGSASVNTDPDTDGRHVTLNIRYPGQYFDQETGLHYNYFRYYDPDAGRYITSDPIGLAGGLNAFSYAHNNTHSNIDTHGLLALNFISGGVGAAVEAYKNYDKYSGLDYFQRVALGFVTGFIVPGRAGLTVSGGLVLGTLNAGAEAINQATDGCASREIDLNRVAASFAVNQTGALGYVFGRSYTGRYFMDQLLSAGLSKYASDFIVDITPYSPATVIGLD